MVSTRPLISKSFSHLPILWWLYQVHQLKLVSPSFSCSTVCLFFNSIAQSRYLSFFSPSFNCTLWSAGTAKSTISQILVFLFVCLFFFALLFIYSFFFVYYYKVWLSGRNWVIFLDLKFLREFVRLIIWERFRVAHIRVPMVKFQFLVQFPMDNLAHPVVSWLLLSPRKFSAFDYYVIDLFVPINFVTRTMDT